MRKKRTQLTVRVFEIAIEMRYTDVLWRNIRNARGQDKRDFHITWSAEQAVIQTQSSRILFKCRVSNPSSLIDLSAPHSQTMKPTICCAHWYLFYINVSKWMRLPETAEQQNCKTLISGVWHVQCRTLSASGKHGSCERTVRQVLSESAKMNNKSIKHNNIINNNVIRRKNALSWIVFTGRGGFIPDH
jgi:hypothetical protein